MYAHTCIHTSAHAFHPCLPHPSSYHCHNALFFTVSMQEEYDEDVIKIEELFTPLVLKCKENGRAMRIGTNHGIFPDRMPFRGFYFL
jgi:hypothetical protein